MTNELPASWREHDRRIRPYLWSHRILGWCRGLLGLFLVGALLYRGRGATLADELRGFTQSPFPLWLLFFGGLAVAWEALTLPFSVLSHWVERRHGLSRQSYGAWLWDRVKGWMVGAVLGTVVLGIVFGSLMLWREHWWLLCAGLLILFSVLLAQLAPVLLIPLFFKLHPMEPGPLKQRLLDLCGRFGIDVKDVYHLGLSDKTEKGNAAFTGLGRTKRILIGDTLYQKYPPEQVEAVFAHELGHQVHNDLWKGIGLSVLTTLLSFYVAQWITGAYLEDRFDVALETPFGMFLFFVALSVVQIPLGWLTLAFSRHREREADRFAAEVTRLGKPLADSLERLTFQNRGPFKPHPLVELFRYSHPAPWRRISRLRG